MKLFIAGICSTAKQAAGIAGCILVLFFVAGCGARSLKSVEITPTSADLVGIGATQQFSVIASYTDGSKFDVTSQAKYSIATPNPIGPVTPPNAITVNASGQAQAVLAACTWTGTPVTTGNPPTTTIGAPFFTAPYVLTATFDNQSGTSFVSVASVGGCSHP
jgi:hypothetical protein